jgi:hypothetical protein
MARPKTDDIDPHALAADLFRRLGGIDGMTRWAKNKQTLAYQLIANLMKQPASTTFNKLTVNVNEGEARRKLEDALMRMIDDRGKEHGAVYHGGVLIDDDPQLAVPRLEMRDVDHEPPDPRSQSPDPAPGSDFENLKSPKQGTLFEREPAATSTAEGKKNIACIQISPVCRRVQPLEKARTII